MPVTSAQNPPTPRVTDDFRGDFEAVAAMMEDSWAGSVQPPQLYTPAFLQSWFDYPGMDHSLAPTIYEGSTPVAFVAGFPRRVRLHGRERKLLVATFLTAAAEHKQKGYGILAWSELVRRAREAGLDGVVNYCVEGEPMERMIVGACRRVRIPVVRAYSIQYASKLLLGRPGPIVDEDGQATADAFLRAAAPIADSVPLARLWTAEEARWQCTRAGAVVARRGEDGRAGLVTGYVVELADRRRTACVFVDDVLWGELADEEKSRLVETFVRKATAAGARIAVLPRLGYADLGPFLAHGFRPSQRVVHMYLSVWSDPDMDAPVGAAYLDVF